MLLIADAPCHGEQYHIYKDNFPRGDEQFEVNDTLQKLVDNNLRLLFVQAGDVKVTEQMVSMWKKEYDTRGKKKDLVMRIVPVGESTSEFYVALRAAIMRAVEGR